MKLKNCLVKVAVVTHGSHQMETEETIFLQSEGFPEFPVFPVFRNHHWFNTVR